MSPTRPLTIAEWAVLVNVLRQHGIVVEGRRMAALLSDASATTINGDIRDAGVAELAYAADSKPAPERGEGSSPSSSTTEVM